MHTWSVCVEVYKGTIDRNFDMLVFVYHGNIFTSFHNDDDDDDDDDGYVYYTWFQK